MFASWLSLLFVFIQFLSLGVIALTGPLVADNPVLLALELAGLALGVWAVVAMRIGNFHITPEPLKGSKMVSRGPYKFIRHPMSLGTLDDGGTFPKTRLFYQRERHPDPVLPGSECHGPAYVFQYNRSFGKRTSFS